MHHCKLIVFLAVVLSTSQAANPLPSPLSRATQAAQGLMEYFSQTERGGRPLKRPEGCPCFSCSGKNCTVPLCDYCAQGKTGCPSKQFKGCYTTAKKACYCDDPAGPLPYGANTAANFFFSCGQIGGLAPYGKTITADKCLCESDWPSACTNCYRWWSAIALEAAVNFCLVTQNSSSSLCNDVASAAESMWIHSPYNAEWDAVKLPVYVDDFAWFALAYLKMFEWTGNDVWRQRSAGIHDWAWKYGWDSRTTTDGEQECGGFYWNLNYDMKFKDSISIVELLHVAARHATLKATPESDRDRFAKSAHAIWDWLFEFSDGDGLFAPNGIMSTAAVPELCCRASMPAKVDNFTHPGPACSNSRIPGMTYNHGLLMTSASLMYNLTGDKSYLSLGISLLDAAIANLTDSHGAILDAQRGSRVSLAYACSSASDPGADFFSFKGVFAAHLAYFAENLNTMDQLTSDTRTKLLSILQKTSDNAWSTAAVFPPFDNVTNICQPAGANLKQPPTNSTAPKFYWWWSNPNASLETPPDNRLWFTVSNSGVRCTYHYVNTTGRNGTFNPVLWNGTTDNETVCKRRCADDAACIKYMFYGSESAHNLQDSQCQCYDCAGKICKSPHCVLCSIRNETCPHKTSQGCYTNASVACNCPGPKPQPYFNCWLYRQITHMNRSKGAACTNINYDYQLGVKRPPPPSSKNPGTTCRNRCSISSSEIIEDLPQGNVSCFCDAACARHLDCCLDYVDECLPEEGQAPTCLGKCNSADEVDDPEKAPPRPPAVPIRGGGYCYCHSGCLNYFTDNNSKGGCCADMPLHCMSAPRDPVCHDSRTAAQALQLFVAHHVLEDVLKS